MRRAVFERAFVGQSMTAKAVVVGVGGIGAAVANALIDQGYGEVHAVSRSTTSDLSSKVRHWSSDYSDASIESIAGAISDRPGTLERLIITNGILQGEGYRPERALRQLSRATMSKIDHALGSRRFSNDWYPCCHGWH